MLDLSFKHFIFLLNHKFEVVMKQKEFFLPLRLICSFFLADILHSLSAVGLTRDEHRLCRGNAFIFFFGDPYFVYLGWNEI